MSFAMTVDDELAGIIEVVHVDRAAGLERLKVLAAAGNKSAILSLGLYLSEVPVTYEEAIPWLEQAAAFDSADAAWNLAMIARQRDDPAAMRHWIDRAATLGERDAIKVRESGYNVSAVLESYR